VFSDADAGALYHRLNPGYHAMAVAEPDGLTSAQVRHVVAASTPPWTSSGSPSPSSSLAGDPPAADPQGLASAGAPAAELAAVVFTHLHQDHCRGATWSGELTFPRATGFAAGHHQVLVVAPVDRGALAEELDQLRATGSMVVVIRPSTHAAGILGDELARLPPTNCAR
jgi:hypothetical protein